MANQESTLTQEYLKEILDYNPETGLFTRLKITSNRVHIGGIAGTSYIRHGKKYKRVQIDGRKYLSHRLAWLYMTGDFPEDEIDHVDGNGINNKWDNLSDVTHQENSRNVRLRSNNSSGVIGVHWHKADKKWRTHIVSNNKQIFLGRFRNKQDAIKARKEAEIKYNYHPNHGSVRPL